MEDEAPKQAPLQPPIQIVRSVENGMIRYGIMTPTGFRVGMAIVADKSMRARDRGLLFDTLFDKLRTTLEHGWTAADDRNAKCKDVNPREYWLECIFCGAQRDMWEPVKYPAKRFNPHEEPCACIKNKFPIWQEFEESVQ